MLIPGLVSVTFRQLDAADIVREVSRAGLATIEWGGDVHAPPTEPARARRINGLMDAAGLRTAAYGSYFRLGGGADPRPWLDQAVLLRAPTMRIWAGATGSAAATAEVWQGMSEELRAVAVEADLRGLTLSLEFHENTLADRVPTVRRLIAEAAHPAVRTYWQPPKGALLSADLKAGLVELRPWLTNLHVFHRDPASGSWTDLSSGAPLWAELFAVLEPGGPPRSALIEFVRDQSVESFHRDAATLLSLLAQVGNGAAS